MGNKFSEKTVELFSHLAKWGFLREKSTYEKTANLVERILWATFLSHRCQNCILRVKRSSFNSLSIF